MPFDAGQFDSDMQRVEATWRELHREPPPRPPMLNDGDADLLTRVVNRISLARILYSPEIFSEVNRQAGVLEDTALRLFLLTSVIDLLGSPRSTRPSYRDWLGSAEARTIALDAIDPSTLPDNSEASRRLHVARRLSERFRELEIDGSPFGAFFRDCLTSEATAKIAEECWVFSGTPLVPTALHLIREPYHPLNPDPMSASLSRARTRWDGLTLAAKLRDIADFLRTYRGNYAHGLLTYWASGEKDPIPPSSRRAAALARAQPARVASKQVIAALSDADKYHIGDITIGLERDCILVPEGISMADMTRVTAKLALWARIPESTGETVLAWNRDLALATYDRPLPRCLMDWIVEAMDAWIRRRAPPSSA